jgi:hypothetical protein
VVAVNPGPVEANGMGSPIARLSREVDRQVTYALRTLEVARDQEFNEVCKPLMIIVKILDKV